MARRNVLDYKNVLSILESRVAPDRTISLGDIEEAFVKVTDKSRPETIRRHIGYMIKFRVIQQKGELTYRVVENWKALLDECM